MISHPACTKLKEYGSHEKHLEGYKNKAGQDRIG